MKCIIVTGFSGAGKSNVIKYLEDIGYFCVDNMLPTLISGFIQACSHSRKKIDKVALVVDARGGEFFDALLEELDNLDIPNCTVDLKILFLEAKHDVLVSRYKETRRKHPLSPDGTVSEGINLEEKLLAKVRARADQIIDTTKTTTQQLRDILYNLFDDENKRDEFMINIISFGFKYGQPIDTDIVFDVRFLPNPFYIPELKEYTGLDRMVSEYVMKWDQTRVFIDKITDLFDFLLPYYKEEGKQQLVIGIGCTGGKHRSVAIAEALYSHFKKEGRYVTISHRDYLKDGSGKIKRDE